MTDSGKEGIPFYGPLRGSFWRCASFLGFCCLASLCSWTTTRKLCSDHPAHKSCLCSVSVTRTRCTSTVCCLSAAGPSTKADSSHMYATVLVVGLGLAATPWNKRFRPHRQFGRRERLLALALCPTVGRRKRRSETYALWCASRPPRFRARCGLRTSSTSGSHTKTSLSQILCRRRGRWRCCPTRAMNFRRIVLRLIQSLMRPKSYTQLHSLGVYSWCSLEGGLGISCCSQSVSNPPCTTFSVHPATAD